LSFSYSSLFHILHYIDASPFVQDGLRQQNSQAQEYTPERSLGKSNVGDSGSVGNIGKKKKYRRRKNKKRETMKEKVGHSPASSWKEPRRGAQTVAYLTAVELGQKHFLVLDREDCVA
jgi:hypothetical protein